MSRFAALFLLLLFPVLPLHAHTRGLDFSGTLDEAGGIGGLLARTETISNQLSTAFYHADASGNITALMDGRENMVARYLYEPFGGLLAQWGKLADANVMQSSSKPVYRGMVDHGLRWRIPRLDRFANNDPIQNRTRHANQGTRDAKEIDAGGASRPTNQVKVRPTSN